MRQHCGRNQIGQVQSLNEIVVTVGNSAAALLAGVLLNDVG